MVSAAVVAVVARTVDVRLSGGSVLVRLASCLNLASSCKWSLCFAPNFSPRLFYELNEAELRIRNAVVEMHEVFRELLIDHLQGCGPQLPRSPVKLVIQAARQESRAWRNVRRNITK